MKAIELEKAYDPKTFEDRIYTIWKEAGAFKPEIATARAAEPKVIEPKVGEALPPYVIVIPPPNVTGMLHLGHGLVTSIIDIVMRYHRMKGEPALWVPGSDHAGIATQHVVEKMLLARGLKRQDLGREKFVEETWKVKEDHHKIISRQMSRMGASVDWDRERFTMDEGLSRAVREVFVTLYERDLMYKGNYLVNWCCSCGTALADDEVEHEDSTGKMYHLRYPFTDGSGFVEIATTRPETMLGDTAVAVNPEDERYTASLGKMLRLPLTGREIPLLADSYVDKAFGTGALKVTPAHDPNDWEVARRHSLQVINIITPDGRLNEAVPEKYRFLTLKAAREKVLEDLTAQGFYVGEENITHAVGHCYRCHTVIEPYLSEQWFVRMKPLAEKALASWRRGEIIFYPKKWENTYEHWLENIRDWCVSRQLWWGHRIPAWYCRDCGKTSVSRTDLSACPHCGSKNIAQDPDVLDTWFSSWLWPFSVMGWENSRCDTADFRTYYPTSALVTAYDIIFFWVARMIMAGLEFTGKAPFRDVYIHQLIRDKQGRKMSKSLGNGIDPLEIVDEFGADALKFTLAYLCAQGQDILMDKESFKLGSKFANKIWNASRYILMNLEGRTLAAKPGLLPADRWIYSRLNRTARAMEEAFLSYRFNDAAQIAYEYFWNDFCDWYVEFTKYSMKEGSDSEKDRAATVLLGVLAESLRLLHPLLPFVTEEIYGKLPPEIRRGKGSAAGPEADLLITAPYPVFSPERDSPGDERNFTFLQDLVRMIRTLRSECTVPPEKKIRVLVRLWDEDYFPFVNEHTPLVKLLAGIGELETRLTRRPEASALGGDASGRPAGSIGLAGAGFEAFVYIAEAVDMNILKQKFAKELERDRKFIQGLKGKLANENFLKNAPPELVEGERRKLDESEARSAKIEFWLKEMER
ncbi:MAG: valine--tRNA ligase [Treponema sp.]|nr:valine--tRNA ligase [Treponema sp.]